VATIVEGHGEVNALPVLLERVWREIIKGEYIEVLRPPIRQPRNRLALNKDDALKNAVELAAKKLHHSRTALSDPELILILIDADSDPACLLAPKMLQAAQGARKDKNIACVLAVIEYETWFVASAASLGEFLNLDKDLELPKDPELQKLGKGWIQKRFKAGRYSESIDQTKLTAKMDLKMCREKSLSFDKLCRDLEKMASPPP
jgi:hypothetical protein